MTIFFFFKNFLNEPENKQFVPDVKFNKNNTRIVASRIIIHTFKINDTQKETAMVETYRDIARNSQFNITVFNPNFILFDQVSKGLLNESHPRVFFNAIAKPAFT